MTDVAVAPERDDMLLECVRRALGESQTPLCVALASVDFLAEFIAHFGEPAGDDCLRMLERSLASALPKTPGAERFVFGESLAVRIHPDIARLERVGRGTFLAVFPGASVQHAADLAERLRIAAASQDIALPEIGAIAVSLSIGVAAAGDATTPEALSGAVLEALYAAQSAGRNCVAVGTQTDLLRDARNLQRRFAVRSAALTPTIGRAREIAELGALLEERRFVTLAGPAGVGKTHLANAVAHAVPSRFRDGVFFIRLDEERDRPRIALAIAEKLGVRHRDAAAALHSLEALFRRQEALLVVDDASHAPAETAAAIAALLDTCPQLRILATARTPLGGTSETVFHVAPLSRDDAAQLFVARAGTGGEGLADAAACLGGNPLAIEIVASAPRTEAFAMLGHKRELDGVPESIIAWRFERLDASERRVLACLTVFAGGWAPSDLQSMCRDAGSDVRAIVARLVDATLVVHDHYHDHARYRLPRAIAEYAAQRLDDAERIALARRHAEHFANLVAAAPETWAATPVRMWLPPIEREIDNFRAALGWCMGAGRAPVLGARLAIGLTDFWYELGAYDEGVRYLRFFLDAPPLAVETRAALHVSCATLLRGLAPMEGATHAQQAAELAAERGDLLTLAWAKCLGGIAAVFSRSDPRRALADLEQAFALFTQLGNRRGTAQTHGGLGLYYAWAADWDSGRYHYHEALRLFRMLGNDGRVNMVLNNLAQLCNAVADLNEAVWLLHETMVRREWHPHMHRLDLALANLAEDELARGNVPAARGLLGRAVRLLEIAPHARGLGFALSNVARCAHHMGAPRVAIELAAFSDAALERLGIPRSKFLDAPYRTMLAEAREQLGIGEYEAAYARGRSMTSETALSIAGSV